MHLFSDKTGQSWEIELTVGMIEKIKDTLKIDLFDPVGEDNQLIADLAPIDPKNIKLFIDMIGVICEKQQEKLGLSSSQFTELLSAESLREAYSVFYEEWALFFQSLGRKDLGNMIQKMNSLIQEGVEEAVNMIKGLTYESVKYQITKSATSSQE